MARRVRITVSVFFAVLTVLLCALWVQSYRHGLALSWASTSNFVYGGVSIAGEVRYAVVSFPTLRPIVPGWTLSAGGDLAHEEPALQFGPRFEWSNGRHGLRLIVPHWCLVAIAATAFVSSSVLWVPWSKQFRLRTLFIVMTLVAVLLGLGIWLTSILAG